MEEKDKKRMDFLSSSMESLKKIEKEQQTTIQHIAGIQGEMQSDGKETVAAKIGEVFSNASRNTQLLHEIIDEFQTEYNRLKSQG